MRRGLVCASILAAIGTAPLSSRPSQLSQPAAAIKFLTQIGGFAEAEEAFIEVDKPGGWEQDLQAMCAVRRESLAAAHASFAEFYSGSNEERRARLPPINLIQTRFARAQLLAYEGRMDRAVDDFRRAYQGARAMVPAAVPGLQLALGIIHLHKSFADNDAYRAPGEMCLLPLAPGRSFARTIESERAIEHLLTYLEDRPEELDVRWLLNLAYMTIGKHPHTVPPEYLVPPSVFNAGEEVGRFHDVARDAGLNVFAEAGGVIVEDFTGAGRFDVVTSSMDPCEPVRYFAGSAGVYSDRRSAAGLDAQLGGLNLVPTDYDNDGCRDILILRGGGQMAQRRSLLRSNCDGTFTDVTVKSGLAAPATSSQAAAWADIDNNGLLDLFVANQASAAQLFRNKGDGTFEDIGRAAGVSRVAFSMGVAAGDYDNDGLTDFYVSNRNGGNVLYRNNGNRTFTETTRAAGVGGGSLGYATWFFDYDNDGWEDLFAASSIGSLDESVRAHLGVPRTAEAPKLYRNLRDGTFRDMGASAGFEKALMSAGANFGDIDNDGFLDIYLGTGDPSYASLVPSVLLRNRDGAAFADVTASSGTGELHKGHGIAFADLDNDGDQEIVVRVGGATPGDRHAMRVFENPGHGNDWIRLRLVGTRSNRAAIGARITVRVGDEGGATRAIHRTVRSGGSFGASPLEQHIGLGKSARSVDLEIWWPASNTRQRFAGVEKNQVLEITELAAVYRRLERPRVRLGGSRRAGAVR
jgi:tetratricopeptide (TPR) repeat protein